MARRLFIAGNWKLHKGPHDADTLATALKRGLADCHAVDIAVAPPAISITTVVNRLKHTGIDVAGQNIHPAEAGAFTGEMSGEMLRQSGALYSLVGHSERRTLFNETDEQVNEKMAAVFRAGLLPILCVGETLQQRERGVAETVVTQQLSTALKGLNADQVSCVTVAYEPVWAIGTGRTATPDQAQAMHAHIRHWLLDNYPKYVGNQIRIQYGGSVKPSNAATLFAQPDIDGALVGGAALDPASFIAIIEAGTFQSR